MVTTSEITGGGANAAGGVNGAAGVNAAGGANDVGGATGGRVGAAGGAVLGRVIGGNTRGTVIGGVVGAAGGAVVAAHTADRDVVVKALDAFPEPFGAITVGHTDTRLHITARLASQRTGFQVTMCQQR